ncbi:MAG: Asp23/Gls24 family envelope stress response protein [Bacillales bacterium]|jgi:uncharacterized alkaline shock family protein YloU|nr:Asp23/Gls24 family envelope stress response protein [Bacillales bacterium]
MGKEYFFIENYSKKGKIGLSKNIFQEIAYYVLRSIDGVDFYETTAFKEYKPKIICNIRGSKVSLILSIRANYNYDIFVLSETIRKQIIQQIKVSTEVDLHKIDVRIEDVR